MRSRSKREEISQTSSGTLVASGNCRVPATNAFRGSLSALTLLDILLRLNETVDRIENAYASYLFTEVAQLLYEFVWSDFCDWYLEAAKTELQSKQEVVACNCLGVVGLVLSSRPESAASVHAAYY